MFMLAIAIVGPEAHARIDKIRGQLETRARAIQTVGRAAARIAMASGCHVGRDPRTGSNRRDKTTMAVARPLRANRGNASGRMVGAVGGVMFFATTAAVYVDVTLGERGSSEKEPADPH
jgi:hypothetical protein